MLYRVLRLVATGTVIWYRRYYFKMGTSELCGWYQLPAGVRKVCGLKHQQGNLERQVKLRQTAATVLTVWTLSQSFDLLSTFSTWGYKRLKSIFKCVPWNNRPSSYHWWSFLFLVWLNEVLVQFHPILEEIRKDFSIYNFNVKYRSHLDFKFVQYCWECAGEKRQIQIKPVKLDCILFIDQKECD